MAAPTILMLSSTDRQLASRRWRDLGGAAYLTKPVSQRELLDGILKSLGMVTRRGGEPPPIPPTPAPGRALCILLAEDNLVNQALARRMMQKRGHSVTVAANGLEALHALANHTFDLILMDVQMPQMGGFEAIQAIREKEQLAGGHIPIIALTAHAMRGDREKCLEAGADEYVSKPINRQELLEKIERLMGSAEPTAWPTAVEKP